MTPDEYERCRDLAEVVAGEPVLAWWQCHDPNCAFTSGGACNCRTDTWFSGVRWTVCVTPDLQTFRHSLH